MYHGPRHIAAVPAGPSPRKAGSLSGRSISLFPLAPPDERDHLVSSFFHPLDALAQWNRLYGRTGFFQYQFVVPFGEETALRRAVELVAQSGAASFLAVLKRFGPADDALLGFAMSGWTLTLDLPAGADGLTSLVRDLDDLVMQAAGRIYLAKDAVSRPEVIAAGYPQLHRWREICDRVDPDRIWNSDLSRRLELR